MDTTTKAPRTKKLVATTPRKVEAILGQADRAEKTQLKTILVASCGWPTAEMKPSRRAARR